MLPLPVLGGHFGYVSTIHFVLCICIFIFWYFVFYCISNSFHLDAYGQVMGNANALMQSDDWAALIADARERKCFMDMDALPKEFSIPKASNYAPISSRGSMNTRALRGGGLRQRHVDTFSEMKIGVQPNDDEKSSMIMSRNGGSRNSKQLG